ncbi:sigma-70 family RNA polymerase sigma factor [Fundicoccus culcitae]|uniref:Sigma-70 family RNA polymerase sigma factor n=1 Tax=Fundicoccus culcitae TaxID=2969821 RepID=A0ABY5P9B0_9LACT|nr:sigma-70 family RNA polymerase sigma factor [Fundicoccus culcitae]UUX34948.1 sigma-70 family RNA polymerase sigma factor [Fundicoccus culcitae]
MKSEASVVEAIETYGDTIKRICMVYLKNQADTEDIFQNVFIKYATQSPLFDSKEHEKAWLIRVTINECKDFLKSFYKSHFVFNRDEVIHNQLSVSIDTGSNELLDAVLSLPSKYREVLYLFYYEEYSAVEIAELLNKNPNTIYTRLARSRDLLKVKLGESSNGK